MKKILCPVDFSLTSQEGVDYAAHLAQALGCSITLFHVRTTIWPEARQLDYLAELSDDNIRNMLNDWATELRQQYSIVCEAYFESTTNTFEEIIATQALHHDLLVMGTHGADSFFSYVFGSNTFHVISKAKCPVVVVPQGCYYRPLDLIVYAYDPDTNPLFMVEQLKALTNKLGSQVRVLHVEEDPKPDDRRRMEILKEAIKARESKYLKLSFDFQYSEEVSYALTTYMKVHKAGMLALSVAHRTLMEKLFTEHVVKQISLTAEYPVFVFWH
jgi:nucleotide-binding universal stress UspA family protein